MYGSNSDDPGGTRRDWRLIAFSIVWAVFCLAADYATGPGVQFGSLYSIPVFVAAWEANLGLALTIALFLPAAEYVLDRMWGSFADSGEELFTSFVRIVALTSVALLVHRFSRMRTRVERRVALPERIARCEHCGRVQDVDGNWWRLDDRMTSSLGDVVETRCPECATA